MKTESYMSRVGNAADIKSAKRSGCAKARARNAKEIEMKEQYLDINLRQPSLEKIEVINDVLDEYDAAGYTLTVRQLYYQLVSKNLIENSQKSYKNIVSLLTKGRNAGLIDWDLIEDRGRSLQSNSHWETPAEILRTAARSFALDKWKNQDKRLFVMCEKDALSGILGAACTRQDIPFVANKGYSSVSFMRSFGDRIGRLCSSGYGVRVLYFGDHDPSGLDMDDDILQRVWRYGLSGVDVVDFDFERAALLMRQIEEMGLPENPAKITDSRAAKYIEKHGASSWELDAVPPETLTKLVDDWADPFRDDGQWAKDTALENEYKDRLMELARGF
jgi:hypothetical protein